MQQKCAVSFENTVTTSKFWKTLLTHYDSRDSELFKAKGLRRENNVEVFFSPPLESLARPTRVVNVGVLASGSGSNFESIVKAAPSLGFQVCCLVVNKENAGAIERAGRLGIPHGVVSHRDFGSRETFDEAIVSALQSHGAEWVAMAGWMRIASKPLLRAYEQRIVNLHPSLLPSFKGATAVKDALLAGALLSGCSVHHVVEELDAGPLVAQAAVRVHPDDDELSLHARIQEAERVLYPRALAHAIAQVEAND